MRTPTFMQEFGRVVGQIGMTTETPLPIPLTVAPQTYTVVPMHSRLIPELSNFQSMMAFYGHTQGSIQTRWGHGRYSTQDPTTSIIFDEIEERPEDRVTIQMDHVGPFYPEVRSDIVLRRLYKRASGSRTDSYFRSEIGVSFTYEVGTSARLSQFAIMNPTFGSFGKDHSIVVGIYHILLSTEFLRMMADAAETDEELNRLAETCEQGVEKECVDEGIAYMLQTERNPDYDAHYDAAFLYAVDIEDGYAQPVHPLVTSLISGAAQVIPNLMASLEDD